MNKQQAVLIAATYFPNYPSVNEFHVTDDGQVFEDTNNAGNHAKSIQSDEDKKADKKPSYITVTREECIEKKSEPTAQELAEKAVVDATKKVTSLTGALAKAAAKNKAAAQEKLDAAQAELETAKKALAELAAAE
jgi:hypothetical protein